MNVERIERLIDRLQKVKEEHFDINHWYSNKTGLIPKEVRKNSKEYKILVKEGFCGSTACVLGQAALIKEFNEAGLNITISEGLYVVFKDEYGNQRITSKRYAEEYYPDTEHTPYIHGSILYEDEDGIMFGGAGAGSKFFDIPLIHSQILFYTFSHEASDKLYGASGKDITPIMVAKVLREYIDTNGDNVEKVHKEYLVSIGYDIQKVIS